MRENTELKPMMVKFCECYARVDSETYGQKKASAIAAGYSSGSAAEMASRLTNSDSRSIALIEKIYSEDAQKNKGRLLSALEFQRLGAIKAKKWDAANTSVKLQAQLFGFLLADSAIGIIDKEEARLTETQVEQAKAFSKWSLLQGLEGEQQELGSSIISEATEEL